MRLAGDGRSCAVALDDMLIRFLLITVVSFKPVRQILSARTFWRQVTHFGIDCATESQVTVKTKFYVPRSSAKQPMHALNLTPQTAHPC